MTTEIQDRPAAAPATQRKPPLSDYSTAADVVPELAACFALVRPVSMTDDAAAEWLAVAASELAGYRAGLLKIGMAAARKTCTHHGQIIPAIIREMEDATPWRLGKPLERRLPGQAAKQLPPPEVQGLIDGATRALTSGPR